MAKSSPIHVQETERRVMSVPVEQQQAKPRLLAGLRDRFNEAFAMALRSMNAHRLRIASDDARHHYWHGIGRLRRGAGTRVTAADSGVIRDLGTNTLYISPGRGFAT